MSPKEGSCCRLVLCRLHFSWASIIFPDGNESGRSEGGGKRRNNTQWFDKLPEMTSPGSLSGQLWPGPINPVIKTGLSQMLVPVASKVFVTTLEVRAFFKAWFSLDFFPTPKCLYKTVIAICVTALLSLYFPTFLAYSHHSPVKGATCLSKVLSISLSLCWYYRAWQGHTVLAIWGFRCFFTFYIWLSHLDNTFLPSDISAVNPETFLWLFFGKYVMHLFWCFWTKNLVPCVALHWRQHKRSGSVHFV